MKSIICVIVVVVKISYILTQSLNSSSRVDRILDFLIEQSENINETFNESLNSGDEGNNESKIIYLKPPVHHTRRSHTPLNENNQVAHEGTKSLDLKKDIEDYNEYSEEVLVEIVDSAEENFTTDFQEQPNKSTKQGPLRRSGNIQSDKEVLHTFFQNIHDIKSNLRDYPDTLDDQFSNKHKEVDSYVKNTFLVPKAKRNEYPYDATNVKIENYNLKQKETIEKILEPLTLRSKLPDTLYHKDDINNQHSNGDTLNSLLFNVDSSNIFYPPVKKHVQSYKKPMPSLNENYDLELPLLNSRTQAFINDANQNMKNFDNFKRRYNPYYVNLAAPAQNIIRTIIHHPGIILYPFTNAVGWYVRGIM